MPSTTNYDALTRTWTRMHHLGHLQAIANWDHAANMPPKGNEARAAALAEVATLLHGLRTAPELGQRIERAAQEDLGPEQRANLREMERQWRAATALPAALIERQQLATSRCEHAWRGQRPANDWRGFLANFREVLAVGRETAQRLADQSGLGPYEALMDRYEPGARCAQVDAVFGEVRQWLPGLIERVRERQARETVVEPRGPYAPAAQRALCLQMMKRLGFDFDAGRLDVSAHPFCGGVPEDVRITTRFREDDFVTSLMGTVHETGHARYEQNLPRELLGQPVAEPRSMAIHESQSLSFEMQLGGHPGFVRGMAPLLVQAFGDQPAFEPANLCRLLTRVKPGCIRVDADEVTYPAHILLRYEIERPLIEGAIEPEDVPALWDAKMMELLGVDTRGNYRDGPLQDVHWPEALFGYFPCYTLGAMYAAQWFAAMRREMPGLDARIDRGDLAPVFDWLRARIWTQASRWDTGELVRRASGETLNPAHFRAHLEARYLG
ncbi:MAG: carboxypeptidase M32 [Burkholderiales bacterium]|nr:carboxypeptidase M32 [Burkholderiales bacterium]MDE1928271.1 carboxypeptidase M32 [Burkholderiales bacterium]MDE2158791.1 carboxypeptidase M32 [Burkholderiales bacterium]MDE2501779.1 carboxypeptidase M32 [Burkholderiales bacterium]